MEFWPALEAVELLLAVKAVASFSTWPTSLFIAEMFVQLSCDGAASAMPPARRIRI
jgi:hypothetical protein